MDLRVKGDVIETLKYRFECDVARLPAALLEEWPSYEHGLLAYSDAEANRIAADLNAVKVVFVKRDEDQPDAELLEQIAGRVRTRTEALTALTTGKIPPTLGDVDELTARVEELENTLTERTAT